MGDGLRIETLVTPLMAALGGRGLRLVARPGWITVDRAEGTERVEVSWSEAEHAEVVDTLARDGAVALPNGTTALTLGGSLVLQRPPDALRRAEALVAEGWVSPLAARLLNQTLGLGRNLLLVGPWAASVDLAAALLAEGARPAVIGSPACAAPTAWPLLPDAAAARAYGADRVAYWSNDTAALGEAMAELNGVVGWIDARRLDRAMIRFEAAGAGGANPLRVLAALDLVIALSDRPSPRVKDVVEILLVEEGYQPSALFTTGLPPAPTALVPVGAPSFLAELIAAGQSVLAEDLTHAVASTVPPPAARATAPSAAEAALAPAPITLGEPEIESPRPAATHSSFVRAPPRPDPELADAPPPGWELDQLGEEEMDEEDDDGDADAAVMAATFGLAPPPRPAGVTGAGAAQFEGTFADALAQAKERDAALQEELRQAEEEGED